MDKASILTLMTSKIARRKKVSKNGRSISWWLSQLFVGVDAHLYTSSGKSLLSPVEKKENAGVETYIKFVLIESDFDSKDA